MQWYTTISYQITKEAKSTRPSRQNREKNTTLKLKEDDLNLVDGGDAGGVSRLRRRSVGECRRGAKQKREKVALGFVLFVVGDLKRAWTSDTVGPYYGQFPTRVQTVGSVLYSEPSKPNFPRNIVWSSKFPTILKPNFLQNQIEPTILLNGESKLLILFWSLDLRSIIVKIIPYFRKSNHT